MNVHTPIRAHRSPVERLLDGLEVSDRTPALCHKGLVTHVQVKHIHSVVDGLDFLHLWMGRRSGRVGGGEKERGEKGNEEGEERGRR